MKKKIIIGLAILGIFLISLFIRSKTTDESHLLRHDSFRYYYQAEMVLQQDIPEYDNRRVHPSPPEFDPGFFIYATAYSYEAVNSFFPDLSLSKFCFWFSAILSALTVIPIYFIGRILFNSLAGLFAAAFFNLSPYFVGRNMAGYLDTDPLNIFLLTTAIALFLGAISKIKENNINIKSKIKEFKSPLALSILGGLTTTLFAWTWNGFWLPLWIIASFLGLVIIIELIQFFLVKKQKQIPRKNLIISCLAFFFIFIITFSVSAAFLLSPSHIPDALQGPFAFFETKSPHQGTLFPSTSSTVTELEAPDNLYKALVKNVGPLNWGFGVVGIFVLGFYFLKRYFFEEEKSSRGARRRKKEGKEESSEEKKIKIKNLYYSFPLLLVWIISMLVVSLTSVRYGEFFVIPISIAGGFMLANLWNFPFKKNIPKDQSIAWIVILLIVSFISFSTSYYISNKTVSSVETRVTENWSDALKYVKNNTPEDSVVQTWWPYGYWVNAIAERKTLIGGGSQNKKRVIPLWDISVKGCKERNGYIPKSFEEFEVGGHVCIISRIQDLSTLLYTSNPQKARWILKTYQENSENFYLILSPDLVRKSMYWSKFATWDGDKEEGQVYRYKLEKMESSKKYRVKVPKELRNSLFTKLYLQEKKVPGFELIHKNKEIKVYKVKLN